jgi:hypothetical protein
MGRKVQETVAGEVAGCGEALDLGLGCTIADPDLVGVGARWRAVAERFFGDFLKIGFVQISSSTSDSVAFAQQIPRTEPVKNCALAATSKRREEWTHCSPPGA